MSRSRGSLAAGATRRLPSAALVTVAVVASISVSGCADIENGIGTTLEELAASRAAADLAAELERLDGVGFVASDYDAVASRLHVQLVLKGDPDSERARWDDALDAVLAADDHPDLAGSAVAATVLTEDGAGLALSTGTLGAEATAPIVDGWLHLVATAAVDVMVESGGEPGIRVEVSNAGLSGSEPSLRLERVASAAGVERRSPTMTTTTLARLLTTLRELDIEPSTDSWFLPGLISVSGRATEAEQLDAVQSILTSIDSSSPLAVTSVLDDPEGLLVVTTSLGLQVDWYAEQPIDALDLRSMTAWPVVRTIVESVPAKTGASVTLMATGGGASFIVGQCDGTLSEATATELAIVDALRSDLILDAGTIAPGHCTPDL